MKSIWREILLSMFMGLMLPGIMLWLAPEREREISILESSQPTQQTEAGQAVSMSMRLRKSDGSVVKMDMDEYLVGVVLAEMPASFEQEALKAQTVVARTYTQKTIQNGGKHGDGSVCTESTCCQAYISVEDYRSQGGKVDAVEKIQTAVRQTSGYVLTYEGELIEATYFSCSGGSTEDAVAVWGRDFPYLRATSSPGEEDAAHYTDEVFFSGEEFLNALGLDLSGSPEGWLGYTTYTAGGGVNTMVIGKKEYKGTELRSLLGLRSTAFTMTANADGITITTRGFGHRVGMSQYGADAMAVGGSTCREILAHYYRGTTMQQWEN